MRPIRFRTDTHSPDTHSGPAPAGSVLAARRPGAGVLAGLADGAAPDDPGPARDTCARCASITRRNGGGSGCGCGVELLPGIVLRAGRVHEACGPARRVLAAWAMMAVQHRARPESRHADHPRQYDTRARAMAPPAPAEGWSGGQHAPAEALPPTLWIRPAWQGDRINPNGLAPWADPGTLVVVDCPRTPDLLWCAEEALRAGSAALVVIDLPEPPDLTPVRRLHLAAEAGAARARALPAGQDRRARPPLRAPLGLLLTPGQGGAAGVESRWHLAPLPAPEHPGARPLPARATAAVRTCGRGVTGPPARPSPPPPAPPSLSPITFPQGGGADPSFALPLPAAPDTPLPAVAPRACGRPAPDPAPAERWRLDRLRARQAPPARWDVSACPARPGRLHMQQSRD